MPVLNTYEKAILRRQNHSSRFYFSALKPLTLWSVRLNGAHDRGAMSLAFDGGSGLDYSAVEAFQTLWVGSTAGDNDVGRIRIRSITSSDAGVTGTITVDPNNISFTDDDYLTVLHNYELWPWYSYIDGSEVFYKNYDTAYTDENEDTKPVAILNFDRRADFLHNGAVKFWVDASDSYATAVGAAITTYALSVYPTTGVTVTFNTSTGIGDIKVTSSTQEYYWAKLTVTDDNSKTQDTWRCIFAHDPDQTGSTFPHIDFTIPQCNGGWERGGWFAQLQLHDNATLADVPDRAFCILWKDTNYGMEEKVVVRGGDFRYVNPHIGYRVIGGSPCDVEVTFNAGILYKGKIAPNGTTVPITIAGSGDSDALTPTTTDSMISTTTTLNSVTCSGTITVTDTGTTAVVKTEDYETMQVKAVETAQYPALWYANPQAIVTGYVRRDSISHSFAARRGTGIDAVDIVTIDDLLRNNFTFSIELDARPDAESKEWHTHHKALTIGRAAHHIWRWHSTLMHVCNVVGLLDNTDGRAAAVYQDGTLYSMPDTMARQHGIRAHFVTSREGDIHLTQDAQLLNSTDRAALDVVMEMNEEDRSGEVGMPRQPINQTALVYGSGMYWDQTSFTTNEDGELVPDVSPYCSVAPGRFPDHEGESTIQFERQVLTSQNQLNELTGRVYAKANSEYSEYRMKFHGDYLPVLNVHLAEFWQVDVAAGDTIRGIVIPDLKLIPRNANLRFDLGRGAGDVTRGSTFIDVTFEPEVESQDGVTSDCPGLPDLGGDIPVIEPQDLGAPGAILTGSSVYRLPPSSSSWSLVSSDSVTDLIQDPFWRYRTGSTASEDGIIFKCGVGEIERSTDGGDTWADVTPGNPPNSWSDVPAPVVGDVSFVMLDASFVDQGTLVALGNWQNGSGEWRSWISYSTDDATIWVWISLAV